MGIYSSDSSSSSSISSLVTS